MRNQSSKRKRSEAPGGDGGNGNQDEGRNDDPRNRKKKERKTKQRHEEEETAATTMKDATPCIMEETEQSVGKLTAELVEKCDELTTDAAITGQSSERREKRPKKEKKAAKEKKKKKKKDLKKKKKELSNSDQESDSDIDPSGVSKFDKTKALDAQHLAESNALTGSKNRGKIVASSAIEFYNEEIKRERKEDIDDNKTKRAQEVNKITLLLFYTYVEPVWDEATYNFMLKTLQEVGERLQLTGRMRVAKEGVNCTLTGTQEAIVEYCTMLRKLRPKEFENTEFKLTHDLPLAQKFPNLKVFKVVELVHYGLEGSKAPPIAKYQGTHLEPKDYHEMLAEKDTVVIDVRNHYEAAIGRFAPPNSEWLDPKMRKSTEFPVWLDKPETKEMMRGKQVMMYCTGGIRCERASALLKFKMETDPEIKDLGIKGVYQLQGGIDKYFKEFPDGGYWKGKNYVFDKRFAHAPPKVDGELHGMVEAKSVEGEKMGKCEACHKPWDMYRGKRRCPTCGVPSLICRECFLADREGKKKLGKQVRCDLCVEQGITSKRELREKDQQEIEEYEHKMAKRGLLKPEKVDLAPNPEDVTRLALKNMCRKNMDEATLMETLPGITHIVWRIERMSGQFLGQGWVEMATPQDAARAVARDGKIKLFGRPLYISYQKPDGKDVWPPPNSAVDPTLYPPQVE